MPAKYFNNQGWKPNLKALLNNSMYQNSREDSISDQHANAKWIREIKGWRVVVVHLDSQQTPFVICEHIRSQSEARRSKNTSRSLRCS